MGWGTVAALIGGSLLGTAATNSTSRRNTRENNAFQLKMSETAHQREVKDLKSAGLNPILSARGAGAPQPSSAAAKVEPYNTDFGQKVVQAEQIKLLEAQSRKTNAEAVNTELQRPYNEAMSDIYGSIAGVPVAGAKAFGAAASGYGLYRGARAVGSMLRRRKAKRKSIESGLRPGEKVNRSTGEISKRRFTRRPSSTYRSKSLRSKAFAPKKNLSKAFKRSYKAYGRFRKFK
jgi:alkylated DNA nucleotide flippase Atl1